jgi:hypothetical protein
MRFQRCCLITKMGLLVNQPRPCSDAVLVIAERARVATQSARAAQPSTLSLRQLANRHQPRLATGQLPARTSAPPRCLEDRSRRCVKPQYQRDNPKVIVGLVIRITLVGKVTDSDELAGKSSYFICSDFKKWRNNTPNYSSIRYSNVYPGMDLVYDGNQRHLPRRDL